MTSFYSEEELKQIGFRTLGTDIFISRKVSIYGAEHISIGNHVRIDDFCILSGYITLGNYIHIAAYAALYGGESGIFLEDYASLSSRVTVYGASDDYSGEALTNPMVPDELRNVQIGPVHIEKHVIVGATSIILPGITLREGSAFGSFSFINKDSESWSINTGIPARKIKDRSRKILDVCP